MATDPTSPGGGLFVIDLRKFAACLVDLDDVPVLRREPTDLFDIDKIVEDARREQVSLGGSVRGRAMSR